MLVVGLTGGIASGKSTVSSLLSSVHHLPIVDADLIARQILEPGHSAYKAVLAHFGPSILQPESDQIDRSLLGKRIFSSQEDRKVLNGITHPAVRREMVKQVGRAWMRGEEVCVCDVPLLIEAGLWKFVGEVVVVYVDEDTQLSRLLARPPIPPNPSLSQEDALARVNAQMPLSQKINYATSILRNTGSEDELRVAVAAQVVDWRTKARRWPTAWACWVVPPLALLMGALRVGRRWLEWRRKEGRKDGSSSSTT